MTAAFPRYDLLYNDAEIRCLCKGAHVHARSIQQKRPIPYRGPHLPHLQKVGSELMHVS